MSAQPPTPAPLPVAPPNSYSVWLKGARPQTLPAAVVPVLVGVALAARSGRVNRPLAAATMAAAVLIQVGTNLANDYYDFVAGADNEARLGPRRLTQSGAAAPSSVKRAALGVLGLAALVGLYLVYAGGWPILLVGVLSLLSALAYTAGPWPLAYHGLGDAFVFVFFGLVAVNGTVYLQRREVNLLGLCVSVAVGCLVTAILVVNNLRDIASDRKAGKRTLAVRLGERATRVEYLCLVGGAFLSLPLIARLAGVGTLLALGALPLALSEAQALRSRRAGELNRSLAGTARLHLLYGLLLAIGLVL